MSAVAPRTEDLHIDELVAWAKVDAVKHDESKPRFDLIPPNAMYEIADIYTYGANKYGDRNWEKGMSWSRLYAAVQRHLNACHAGQELDEESTRAHLAHAATNLIFLLEYARTHEEFDDRGG